MSDHTHCWHPVSFTHAQWPVKWTTHCCECGAQGEDGYGCCDCGKRIETEADFCQRMSDETVKEISELPIVPSWETDTEGGVISTPIYEIICKNCEERTL